jgi:outer membrane protein TolC
MGRDWDVFSGGQKPSPVPTRTADVQAEEQHIELHQSLLDLSALSRTRSAVSAEDAAHSDYKDVRETVVVAITSAYLSVLTAQARLQFAQADFKTAQALLQLAEDRERTGLSPEVDTLRAPGRTAVA